MSANNESITVVVRCRPMNKKETDENRKDIIEVDSEGRQVGIKNPENLEEKPKYFTFDATYGDKTQQRLFYEESCFGIIESTLEGFNSTIFAYGQTGCGKSFTMQGPSTTDENLRGVIPNSFEHVFQFVKTTKDVEFLIRCSYLELYNEEIRDLLGNSKSNIKCELKEDPKKGIYIKNLSDVVVESPEDLNKMLDKGLGNRTVAATLMNSESSRSHSIFTIIVEMSTKDPSTGKEMLRVGKLNLVDLAGSERAKKTGATDQTLKEGIRINLSLSVLGNVISALAEGSKHIPYRDSKLTRLLQDSLGGNTKTMMVAAISPADYNFEETLSTLRYANRAKNIKNKPKINEDPKDTMIREFKAEIERLRKLLAEQSSAAPIYAELIPNEGVGLPQQHIAPPTTEIPNGNIECANITLEQPVAIVSSNAEKLVVTEGSEDIFSEGQLVIEQLTSENVERILKDAEYKQELLVELKEKETIEISSDDQNQVVPSLLDPPAIVGSGENATTISRSVSPRWSEPNESVERQMRDELEQRLHQLEHMLMTSEEATIRSSPLKEKKDDNPTVKTPQQVVEEEKSLKDYKEKKVQAKKRREEKQQREMQKILEEKRILAEELEELKQGLLNEKSNTGDENQVSWSKPSSAEAGLQSDGVDYEEVGNVALKKLGRLRKRYEKKLVAAKEELEDLREDFYFQRKQLMDAMLEQEKDAKLYELICKSILSDKDLKKIIDKCRYDEENDEWIIPFSKKKSVESLNVDASNNSSRPTSSRVTNAALFPDIHQPVGNAPKVANSSIEQKFSSLQSNGWALNVPIDGSSRPSSQALGKKIIPKQANSSSGGKKFAPVPLLTLPGSLVTVSSLTSPRPSHNNSQTSSRSELGDPTFVGGFPGIGFDNREEKKKKQSKTKISKTTTTTTPVIPYNGNSNSIQNSKMPSITSGSSSGNETGVGEVGNDVGSHLDDWGFAIKPPKSSRISNVVSSSVDFDHVAEDLEDTNLYSKKKKIRQARNNSSRNISEETSSSYSGGSLLPPIDHRHQTPRLPPL